MSASAYEAQQVLRMCLKYRVFLNEDSNHNGQDKKM